MIGFYAERSRLSILKAKGAMPVCLHLEAIVSRTAAKSAAIGFLMNVIFSAVPNRFACFYEVVKFARVRHIAALPFSVGFTFWLEMAHQASILVRPVVRLRRTI